MKLFWKIASGLLAVTAVVWIIVGNFDRAFLFAAAGAIAWFLSYRAQIKEELSALDAADKTEADETEVDEDESDEENL